MGFAEVLGNAVAASIAETQSWWLSEPVWHLSDPCAGQIHVLGGLLQASEPPGAKRRHRAGLHRRADHGDTSFSATQLSSDHLYAVDLQHATRPTPQRLR